MKEEDLLYTLAIQGAHGVGDVHAKKLIAHLGTAKEIYKTKKNTIAKIHGIGKKMLNAICKKTNLERAEKQLKHLQENNIRHYYFQEDSYPKNLQNCFDGPILLFSKGKVTFNKQPMISIVGTRKMTTYGEHLCQKLIDTISPYRPTIVSGFAYGVDICAHKAAINHQLQTIAVTGHGFEEIYPKVHKKYVVPVEENGGFITDFWYDDVLLPVNFLKRNRIVAGIADAVIVIESAVSGGSLNTAEIANSYNRDVFTFPGRVDDTFSKGCLDLIKSHKATMITCAEDIIKHLNWDSTGKPKEKIVQKQLFIEMTAEEQKAYDLLATSDSEELDSLCIALSMHSAKLATLLFQMEMKGLVTALPGKRFKAL